MRVLHSSRDGKHVLRLHNLTHQSQSTVSTYISTPIPPSITSSHPTQPPLFTQNRIPVTVRYSLSMHRLCLDIFQPVTLLTKKSEKIKFGWKRWTFLVHTRRREPLMPPSPQPAANLGRAENKPKSFKQHIIPNRAEPWGRE